MTDHQREITLFVVGESRNDATDNGALFDDIEGALEYARDNFTEDYHVYRASTWIAASTMVEIDDEEYSL